MQRSRTTILLACALILGANGCAQAPPRESGAAVLERTESIIVRADRLQAATFARDELRAARTQLSKAKAARHFGDRSGAQRLARQALADAQLALARAQARTLEQRVQALRDQLNRTFEQAHWTAP